MCKGFNMNLSQALNTRTPKNRTKTENGDVAYITSGTALLDMVAKIAACRKGSDMDILNLFIPAYRKDRIKALQLLFYVRDIPNRGGGGLGERRVFHVCFKWLINKHYEDAVLLFSLIPEYGYWKDVRELSRYCFHNRFFDMAQMMLHYQTSVALSGDALAAKYAIDSNDRDVKYRQWAIETIWKLTNLSPRNYRKALVAVRNGVVENLMSHNQWAEIDFSAVPSKATKVYRNAFQRHEPQRYAQWLTKVESGNAKINAGTLNPVEIVAELMKRRATQMRTLEAQWNALPNFVDEDVNALVMADVSGSMSGEPIQVAIALAMYFAERNKGMFHNQFMTFSATPQLVSIMGDTLYNRLRNVNSAHWGMNTNLDAAFTTILNAAKNNNVAKEDMPKVLLIISDMQFDSCTTGTSAFERIERNYINAGYSMPHIVFWNVSAKAGMPAPTTRFTTLVSGYSAGVLKAVWQVINRSSINIIDAILSSGRYDIIAERLNG